MCGDENDGTSDRGFGKRGDPEGEVCGEYEANEGHLKERVSRKRAEFMLSFGVEKDEREDEEGGK